MMGALLIKIIKAVCNRLVTLFAACDASMKAVIMILCPRGCGMRCLGGNSSFVLQYVSLKAAGVSPADHYGSIYGKLGLKYSFFNKEYTVPLPDVMIPPVWLFMWNIDGPSLLPN